MVRRTLLFKPDAYSSCPEDDPQVDSKASLIPDLPVQYFRSSDMQIVAAHKADSYDQTQLLHGRLEGEFVLSYKTSGGWVAITKDILTEVLGAGRDVKIVGLPRVAVGALRLMCPNLVVVPENVPPCSPRAHSTASQQLGQAD